MYYYLFYQDHDDSYCRLCWFPTYNYNASVRILAALFRGRIPQAR